MFPNLNTFHPALAASLIQYRVDRLPEALAWAGANNNSGAQWPWESGTTGAPVAAYANEDMFEQHITGDIALAFRAYWYATRDDAWLGRTAWPVLAGSCDFFAGRATPVPNATAAEAKNLTLLHVIGPDERAHIVDSNAYTNGLAQAVLRLCDEAAAALLRGGGNFSGGAPTPARLARWADVADRMWLPLSSTLYAPGTLHCLQRGNYYSNSVATQRVDLFFSWLRWPIYTYDAPPCGRTC